MPISKKGIRTFCKRCGNLFVKKSRGETLCINCWDLTHSWEERNKNRCEFVNDKGFRCQRKKAINGKCIIHTGNKR